MKSDINLDELWAQQEAKPPQPASLFSEVAKMKRTQRLKLYAVNTALVFTLAAMVVMWIYFEPRMIITKLGLMLMLLAIIVFLTGYNRLLPHFRHVDKDQNNSDYLKELLQLKKRQKVMQTSMMQFYFVALGSGIGLYMYEYVSRLPSPWFYVAYGTTLAWIAFNWFYLRPKIIKRDRKKLDTIIERFERVIVQE